MGKLIDRIKNKEVLFFSKKAGSFSGVPQRTVQRWTEDDLIAPAEDTAGGTGNRRKYNILNCIQIAIIKALTDGRVRISTVSDIMERLNGYGGTRLPFLLGYDEAFLVIHLSSTDHDKPYTILYEYFNEENRTKELKTMSTLVFNSDIEKTLIINIISAIYFRIKFSNSQHLKIIML